MRCPHCGRMLRIRWEGSDYRYICLTCDYETGREEQGKKGKRMRKALRVSRSGGGRMHTVYFQNPKKNVAMDELAERLIELKLVTEVILNEEKDGYIAKLRFIPNREPKDPSLYIARCVSRDFGKVDKIGGRP